MIIYCTDRDKNKTDQKTVNYSTSTDLIINKAHLSTNKACLESYSTGFVINQDSDLSYKILRDVLHELNPFRCSKNILRYISKDDEIMLSGYKLNSDELLAIKGNEAGVFTEIGSEYSVQCGIYGSEMLICEDCKSRREDFIKKEVRFWNEIKKLPFNGNKEFFEEENDSKMQNQTYSALLGFSPAKLIILDQEIILYTDFYRKFNENVFHQKLPI